MTSLLQAKSEKQSKSKSIHFLFLVSLRRRKCCLRRRRRETKNGLDRKSTRLNSSHGYISYAVFCLKKKKYRKNTEVNRLLYRKEDLMRNQRCTGSLVYAWYMSESERFDVVGVVVAVAGAVCRGLM